MYVLRNKQPEEASPSKRISLTKPKTSRSRSGSRGAAGNCGLCVYRRDGGQRTTFPLSIYTHTYIFYLLLLFVFSPSELPLALAICFLDFFLVVVVVVSAAASVSLFPLPLFLIFMYFVHTHIHTHRIIKEEGRP